MNPPRPFLTPYQRQTFVWLVVACVLGTLLWLLRPVLTSFLTAGIFAYILHPGVAFLARHKVPRGLAAAFTCLLDHFSGYFAVNHRSEGRSRAATENSGSAFKYASNSIRACRTVRD